MASEGDLVRMENGRWARYQRCKLWNSDRAYHEGAILVAVELTEPYQVMLNAAEVSLDDYRKRGIPVSVRLAPNGDGKLNLSLDHPQSAAVQ